MPIPKDDDEPEDDNDENADDDEDSGSESEEEDEPYNEEDEKLQQFEEKENHELESKALDELMDEFDDPISYYFILKDKKKNVPPELKTMMADRDLSRMGLKNVNFLKKSKNKSRSKLTKKMGQAMKKSSLEVSSRTIVNSRPSPKHESIDDVFDSDPFFDDFSRSMKPSDRNANSGFARVELLRRSKRDLIDDEVEVHHHCIYFY
jgi:hypothetical protein